MSPKPAPPRARTINLSRRKFSALLASLALASFPLMAQQAASVQPEKFVFADDGSIPNNALPLLLYREAFAPDMPDLASAIEERFAKNDWTGSWRAGVFPFHHYHSTTHEVLAVYRGTATLQLGGEKGRKFDVKPGNASSFPLAWATSV
jgi:mannose-6-phosphate isomerase-like protein (cupin superfamily)